MFQPESLRPASEAGEHGDVQQLLLAGQQEMHEMSEQQGEMNVLGALRGDSDPSLWVGKSSLETRLKGGELTETDVLAEIEYANNCYVKVEPGAAKRCVEDRTEEGYDDTNPTSYAAPLGPQIQGGTPDEAVADRLAHNPEAGVSFKQDTEDFIEQSDSQFAPGCHTGTHQGNGKCDCGSIDNEDTKLNLIVDEATAPVLEKLALTLMSLKDKPTSEGAFARLQSAVRTLSGNETYFDDKLGTLEVVKTANPLGKKHVLGDHKQVALIVNMVPGTTLHTNHLNAHNNAERTIHGLDLWNIFEEHDEATQLALCTQAAATLMKITDGSLQLAVRTPKQAAA